MIGVLIVDDHPVVRMGLRATLERVEDIEVVAEASDEDSAVTAAAHVDVNLVLMDLRLGAGGSGVAALRRIGALARPVPVLVLTNHETDRDVFAAVEAGAAGYLLKDAEPEELVAAIRASVAGETALAPRIARRMLDRLRSPVQPLTGREIEVLALVAQGLSNAQIAVRLGTEVVTVKSHLAHIYAKWDVRSRTAAVARARADGLIE